MNNELEVKDLTIEDTVNKIGMLERAYNGLNERTGNIQHELYRAIWKLNKIKMFVDDWNNRYEHGGVDYPIPEELLNLIYDECEEDEN